MEDSEPSCSHLFGTAGDSSGSESDFVGFDITDVRSILTGAEKAQVFTSTPKKSSHDYSEGKECYSDNAILIGDTNSYSSFTQDKDHDSDTSSEISGEFIESIFAKKRRVDDPSSPNFSDDLLSSDEEIDGEFATFNVKEHKTHEDVPYQQDVEAEPTVDNTNNAESKPKGNSDGNFRQLFKCTKFWWI